uniref:Uncharacterized protein n=1 Tax=Picea sitchensis TaxID=3332 RepID=A9NVR8_PICSI|nr:unknown [Picea sitchensis]
MCDCNRPGRRTPVTGQSIEYWRLCQTRRRVGMDKDLLARKCCRRDHYYYTEN